MIKSLIARMRNRFNIGVAEVAEQDVHVRAVIGVVCVSGTADYVRGQLDAIVRWVEEERPDVPLIDYDIEIL